VALDRRFQRSCCTSADRPNDCIDIYERVSRSINGPPFRVTALAPSASIADAVNTHWREYLMEATEIAVLMLSTDICGTLIYADESPIKSLGLTPELKSVLMGTAIAITTFLIIRSPFGRRSGAHFNPAVTLTFFLAQTCTSVGRCLLHRCSVRRRACGCAGSKDSRSAIVRTLRPLHGDFAGKLRSKYVTARIELPNRSSGGWGYAMFD
jgi:hypothetical protein